MKNLNLFILLLVFGISSYSTAQNVNIPDANFKAALVANSAINTNGDAEIQVSEAVAFAGMMNLFNLNIADLTGIETFTALTNLNCSNNQLTSLNLSTNTALTTLSCINNQLSSLNLSTNTSLATLGCQNNLLTSLILSANTALTYLTCFNNQLTSLSLSTNTILTNLNCANNQLTSLNLITNTNLTTLGCSNNLLTGLDLSMNIALVEFYCDNNQLTSLDLSMNTALVTLGCSNNQLTSLDLSTNIALVEFYCNDNQLTSLNLNINTNLMYLYCINNQIINLDFSTNAALVELNCQSNQLITLNVKNGNNSNMFGGNFNATNNPNLTCIEVDDVAYSTTNWTNKDATASYSTNCLLNTTTISGAATNITTYPNPTNSTFQINLGKTYATTTVELRNIMGQTISSNTYNGVTQVEMNIEGAAGLYFVNIRTAEGEVVVKVVKE